MNPKIVFVTNFPDAADVAREMAPSDFDLQIVPAKSAEYREALADADLALSDKAACARL